MPGPPPVTGMQTYSVVSPRETHTRPATCAEAGCAAHLHGWRTVVDESTDLGRQQANYITSMCLAADAPAPLGDGRRRYTRGRNEAGLTVFTFPAGQRCFNADAHRVPLDRPEFYIVRGGDRRGSTGLIRRHATPDGWVEDMAGTLDGIATIASRG